MTTPVKLTAVVLAAGHGTRMKSAVPKVLHPLCGRPMVQYVVDAALDAGAEDVVVEGDGRAGLRHSCIIASRCTPPVPRSPLMKEIRASAGAPAARVPGARG